MTQTLRNYATKFIIPPEKLTQYALNPNNNRGKDKAVVFKSALGFTIDNSEQLRMQLLEKSPDAPATLLRTNQYGQHFRVDIIVKGINYKYATVRTGWLIEIDTRIARLTTLYVKGEL